MPTPEKVGEQIGKILLVTRKKSDRFFDSVQRDLRKLNSLATKEAVKVYNRVLTSLITVEGTSIPKNDVNNLSLISMLMQGIDIIQDEYRRRYSRLLQGARGDLIEITTEREFKVEKALQKIGINENRTVAGTETFELMEIANNQTLKKMNDILVKWRNFAYDTFYSGIIRGVPIAVFKSMFFNKDGSLRIGSSLDEETMLATMTSIGEQRTSYIRKKAEESGYKFCWNANPMDPQTKPECIDASVAGVISEEAMGNDYGFPPRHICRCEIVYTRPEWVRVNQGINSALESRRNILVQSLIDAPRQMASWKVKGKVVRAVDITRLQGNLMYKETSDKLKLLADRGVVPDFVPLGFLGGGGIPPALPPGTLPPPVAPTVIKKTRVAPKVVSKSARPGVTIKPGAKPEWNVRKSVESKDWFKDPDVIKIQKEVLEKAGKGEAFFISDSKTGKSILKRKGGKSSVDVSDLSSVIEKSGSDSFVTFHNHPSSSSFSSADLNVMIKGFDGKTKSNILFGNDGTKYKVSFPEEFAASSKEVTKDWLNGMDELMNKYRPKVISMELTPAEAWKAQSHEIMVNISKKFDFEYERILP